MKTLMISTFVILLASSVHAQSRSGGAGSLGNFKPANKQGYASVKDLDRAGKLAAQARSRTGSGKGGATGWVQGGSWGTTAKRNR